MVTYTSDVLVECVPNISEGRRPEIIAALAESVRDHASLLHVHSDVDHNRTILTFVGAPNEVVDAALGLAAAAVERIDLQQHEGQHPRLGVVDVLPFVPLRDVTLDDCVALARDAANQLGDALSIPTYLYGAAGRPLPEIRRTATRSHRTAGAIAVGARDVLIAFNVDLDTDDLAPARGIAAKIRESGGGLPAVRALGFRLASRGCVQVSMNLLDYRQTSPLAAFREVARLAGEHGVGVRGSEVAGMIPAAAIEPGFAEEARCAPFAVLDPARIH